MKITATLILLAFFLCFSAPANLTLIDRGNGMIYDTEIGITWLDMFMALHLSQERGRKNGI